MDAPGRPRTFQCRQGLWDSFAQISQERGVPLHELIEEAMTAYAQARGHLGAPTGRRGKLPSREDPRERTTMPAGGEPPPEVLDDSDSLPAMHGRRGAPRVLGPTTPPTGTVRMPNRPALPLPAPPMATLKSARSAPTLTLTYLERPHVVDKERYVLGRSKTGADLHLDDPNVSRQHAMIERVGLTWFVVDLGSTNGVFVGGERVARRSLRDGDLVEITTHQIRVTLT